MESYRKSRSKSPSKTSKSPQRSLNKSLSKIFKKEPYFIEKDVDLKFISGPVSWTGFEFGNKAVHFFGDFHFSKDFSCSDSLNCSSSKEYYADSNCMTIDGLIKAIFENSQKKGFYADVFLESPHETKKNKRNKTREDYGYFSDVYNYNFDRMNSGKVYSKVKFHPIDIRFEFKPEVKYKRESPVISFDLFNIISEILWNSTIEFKIDVLDLLMKGSLDFYKSKNYVSFIDNLIKELSGWKDKKDYEYKIFLKLLNEIFDHITKYGIGGRSENSIFYSIKMLESLNKKQITFRGKNISEYIQTFIESEIQKEISTYWEEFGKKIQEEKNIYWKEFGNIAQLFQNISISIMDIATLTKLFKRLEINSEEPQILIIYAGQSHIKNYINFFTDILNLTPLPNRNIYKEPNLKMRYFDEKFRCLENDNFSKIFGKWIDKT
jgi:hypothetical protein